MISRHLVQVIMKIILFVIRVRKLRLFSQFFGELEAAQVVPVGAAHNM